jgi:purine catabolism regulator
VLAAVQQLSGAPVVLENDEHRVLDYRAGPDDVSAFLDDWERRSRRVQSSERTFWDSSSGWLVTLLGRRERGWGRLVIGSPAPPPRRLIAAAERGAATLAMHRLHDRSRDSQLRRLHHELLVRFLAGPADHDLERRAKLAGLVTEGRQFIGVAIRPLLGPAQPVKRVGALLEDIVAICLRESERTGASALVAAFETEVRMLLSVPAAADADSAADELIGAMNARVSIGAAGRVARRGDRRCGSHPPRGTASARGGAGVGSSARRSTSAGCSPEGPAGSARGR